MGGASSTALTDEDYSEIHHETGFSEFQIRRLYSRFSHLDKRSKGYLTHQDFMLIPELAVNPLGTRIIEVFFTDDTDPSITFEEINFRQFIKTLARFKKPSESHPHNVCTAESKIDFIFRIYDKDRDGKISVDDLAHVLTCMVGLNISQDQVNSIVKRTMKEADTDQDNFISLEEFKKALGDINVCDKMSIGFSRT